MKVAYCARVLLLLAAAWSAASDAWAASPIAGSPYPSVRGRTAPSAQSRLNRGVPSRNTSLLDEPEAVAPPAAAEEANAPVPDQEWEGFGDDCGDCCDSCCPAGLLRNGKWYGSVDYLLFRPRLSQGVAEVRRTQTSDAQSTPNVTTFNDQSVEFPFRYQSAFRAAIGYRLLDCGGDIQVAYWRMTANSQTVTDGPADLETTNPFIFGQLKNNPANGQFLSAISGITANIFDVDFAKCLSMGGPAGPCDACFCPRWDLRWSAGARIADISRFDNNQTSTATGSAVTSGLINARFVGAGPRVGLQGRRYFGANGFLSVFARANQSLLIGDYRMTRTKITPGDSEVATIVEGQSDRFSRMVPVTDIEVGGSWQVAPYTFISVGYFFQCWWDLGQSETIIGPTLGPLDTANILSFDGLFVRGELLF